MRIWKTLRRDQDASAITSIDLPDGDGWFTITEPAEVEAHLLKRNQTHFSQAQGTPFTVQPLSDIYDHSATMALDDDLLSLTTSRLDITPKAKSILEALQRKTLPTLYSSVTPDILQNGF